MEMSVNSGECKIHNDLTFLQSDIKTCKN